MTDKIGIHWFRLDLRLNDNPSLNQLSKEVDKIIPIYIYEESIKIGQASKCWLEKSLEKELIGTNGVQRFEVNAYGKRINQIDFK